MKKIFHNATLGMFFGRTLGAKGTVIIISDSCYSGKWIDEMPCYDNHLLQKYTIIASCHRDEVSYDSSTAGGHFT